MMLQNIMGTPLLSWLASSLMAGGVGRFFLVCHERFKREARACFPDDVEFSCPSVEATSDQLHVFLSTADESEEDIIVVTGPAVILPFAADEEQFDSAPIVSPVTSVSKQALMAALDEKFIFTAFLKDHGVPYTDRDGVYGVADLQEMTSWQPVLSRAKLYELSKQGVEIWDYNTTYVDPAASVGPGTALLPGTILRGQTSIGKNCTIGPNSYLENARIGDGTKVNASQVYNSSVGYDTVNYDRSKKYRTVIEDNAFIGCNTNLIAPVRVGEGAYIAAGSTITDDIPAMALSIARARQQNKKDWASKHKLKEK